MARHPLRRGYAPPFDDPPDGVNVVCKGAGEDRLVMGDAIAQSPDLLQIVMDLRTGDMPRR